jgi:CrcB protein
VVGGGAIGTLARYAVERAVLTPAGAGWPTATFVVNVVGAFLLGALVGRLTRPGPASERAVIARLALGTGVLGGFTTYSTLAVETALLGRSGHWGLAVAYPVASAVAGVVAAVAGLRSGRRATPAARPT